MEDFIWGVPDFTQGLLFTLGNVAFLLEIVLLYAGLCFLIDAEKSPRATVLAAVAAIFAALGAWLVSSHTNSSLYVMAGLTAAGFWGTGIVYLLAKALSRLSGMQKLRERFRADQRLIARICGVLLIVAAVVITLNRSPIYYALLCAVVLKGLNLGLSRRKNRNRTHTYDEIAQKTGGRRNVWLVKAILLVSLFFMALYLIWRIFFTIPYHYGVASMIVSVLLLAVEILGAADSVTHYNNMYNIGEYPVPEVPEEKFPHVDIFVSTYSESTELLRKTLLACKRMDYPDRSKVHIYLCDDGRRNEMRVLAEELDVNYLIRDTHEGAKAGNLNFALANSSSPYVVTFDADMQPRSCFLLRTIPYFVHAQMQNQAHPKNRVELGFVQTPQSFYTPDLYQYNLHSERRIPNEQDYFYRFIQVGRTESNSVIYGGSNTVISRKALNDVGGFYTKSITEDFATGILIEKAGYVSLGTAEPLASGMNPHSLRDLIQQRIRWARGVIDTGRKMHIFTDRNLTTAQKLNYWSSIWYWFASIKRLVYILFPILSAFFGVTMFEYILPQMLVFWLPMYVMTRVSQWLLGYRVRTAKWTEIYETAMFPFLLIPVILEGIGISLKKFKVTSKDRKSGRGWQPLYMLPFLALIALSVWGIVNCVQIMVSEGSLGPALLIFWLVNNLYLLVMALFFAGGRRLKEGAERIPVKLSALLTVGDRQVACTTRTVSEEELTLELDEQLPEDASADITLRTERYCTHLTLERIAVKRRKGRYRYTFAITDCDDVDQLLAILYDRVPMLPDKLSRDGGILADLWVNLWRRVWPFSA